MNKNIPLVVGITILFLGLAIQPSIATVQLEDIDVEPKDYLFQTIIDIANNPEVKNLLEQYDNDLFKVDIDRSIYRKLLLRNPRLLFNTLFTKPSITVEYLNKCYNNGIEITNILGKDKVLEIIDSIDIPNTKVFDELNNFITNDEELSGRLVILEEMNEDIKPDFRFPIICSILFILMLPFLFVDIIANQIAYIINPDSFLWNLLLPFLIIGEMGSSFWIVLMVLLNCVELYL